MKDFKTVARNTRDEFEQVTAHLFEQFYIDLLDNDVITGIAIEPLLRGPDFYAQFVTEIQFSVISDDRKNRGYTLNTSTSRERQYLPWRKSVENHSN